MQSGYLRLLVYCSHVIRRHNQLAISQVANKQLRANCEIDLQPTPIYSTTQLTGIVIVWRRTCC